MWSLPRLRHVLPVWRDNLSLTNERRSYKRMPTGLVFELHLSYLLAKSLARKARRRLMPEKGWFIRER
jgi:hypothetical protein